MTAPATFFALDNPGAGHPRCVIPAKAVGGRLVDALKEVERDDQIASLEGLGIWQMVANRKLLKGMLISKAKHGSVLIESDDNYCEYNASYRQGVWNRGLPKKDEFDAPSVKLHQIAVEQATGVIASTLYLAGVYRNWTENVYVCENCIDPDSWPALSEPDGIFRIVYAGTPNEVDWITIRPAMEWAAQQPGVEAWVLGCYHHYLGWPGVKTVRWIKDLVEYRKIFSMLAPNLGLRPFALTEFSKCKSDLKILEYAMVGAMSVVQDWHPYQQWKETGLVHFANDTADWLREVKWAVANQDEVAAKAAATRELVLSTRSLDYARQSWSSAISAASS